MCRSERGEERGPHDHRTTPVGHTVQTATMAAPRKIMSSRSVVSCPVGVEDGFDDEVLGCRPPPALDDRLWRHPAEIGRATPTHVRAPRTPSGSRRNPWALGFVSVVGGAVLAGSLMFTAGGIGDEPQRLGLQPLATLVGNPEGRSGVGIVGIDVNSGSVKRQGNGMVLEDGVHVMTSLQLVPSGAAGNTGLVSVRIIDTNGVARQGAVVARDAMNDLAIIRTDGAPLTSWVATSPASVAVGDPVTALGGGLGTGLRTWPNSVRSTGDAMRNDLVEVVGLVWLTDLLPSVAAGSIIIDRNGGYLGMLSVDLSARQGSSVSVLEGAIVPASRVLAVAEQFLTTGKISHGWLGVEAPPPADTTRRVSREAGATVGEVVDGSPAGLAGVRRGDVLLSVCGHEVDSIDDVLTEVLATLPGTICPLVISRAGERWKTAAVIGERAA